LACPFPADRPRLPDGIFHDREGFYIIFRTKVFAIMKCLAGALYPE
jgi:hypothetical protein